MFEEMTWEQQGERTDSGDDKGILRKISQPEKTV